ncbi:MAG: DNA-3-methyladenine glycosylase [Oscillospiraceae bacterium]|nr:DNA-3-methyladenine glycosylase [Oscillospiraceae bacterium]
MRLSPDFFAQDVLAAAPALLGKVLCHHLDDGTVLRGRITETEAYMANDTACHAHRGRTPRNAVMFAAGGLSYVYLCYGMHNLLNVVTGNEGDPQAVLVRGIVDYPGPGRLTKHLQITRAHNALDLRTSNVLWLEDDGFAVGEIRTAPRVGIGYASAEDQARLWRFIMAQK